MKETGRWMQWDIAAWSRDTSHLTLEQRGFWFEVLQIMHRGSPRGSLTWPTGGKVTESELARHVGISSQKTTALLKMLTESGLASIRAGTLVSRRMMREEAAKQRREFLTAPLFESMADDVAKIAKARPTKTGPRGRKVTPLPQAAALRVADKIIQRAASSLDVDASPERGQLAYTAEAAMTLDGRREDQLMAAVAWCFDARSADARFWRDKVLMPKGLRKHYTRIAAAMATRAELEPQSPSTEFQEGEVDL